MPRASALLTIVLVAPVLAFVPSPAAVVVPVCHAEPPINPSLPASSRRSFLGITTSAAAILAGASTFLVPQSARAIGPIRIDLKNPTYTAVPCPKDKPIPGQMAMRGLKGMCVTVNADLAELAPKDLEKIGVYGFVTDESGESVLANNPDLSTDAGQFTLIDLITPKDKKVEFEFVAAIDPKKDLSQYENGIGQLTFESLRVISYPGGQQYGAINPCEMNEFSDECEAWEAENGPFVKGDFMVKSNPRTKGR